MFPGLGGFGLVAAMPQTQLTATDSDTSAVIRKQYSLEKNAGLTSSGAGELARLPWLFAVHRDSRNPMTGHAFRVLGSDDDGTAAHVLSEVAGFVRNEEYLLPSRMAGLPQLPS